MAFDAGTVRDPDVQVSPRDRNRGGLRSMMLMWTLLVVCDLLLATKGFSALHHVAARWRVRRRRAMKRDSTDVEPVLDEARDALAGAVTLYVRRVQCLQSAFVTTCFLRHRGLAAEMVVGIQKMPFRAHAWCEYNGRPVDERLSVTAGYRVITRCCPPSA